MSGHPRRWDPCSAIPPAQPPEGGELPEPLQRRQPAMAAMRPGDIVELIEAPVCRHEIMRGLLAKSLQTATIDADGWYDAGQGPGSTEGAFINRLTIADQVESVCMDVRRIRLHPLVPRDIPIYGYIYDVKTGQLVEASEATRIGA